MHRSVRPDNWVTNGGNPSNLPCSFSDLRPYFEPSEHSSKLSELRKSSRGSSETSEREHSFRLRYLKVTSNVPLELGTQMRCLQSLETLAIDARVSAVPSDIVQLPGLLHLRLPAETNLPNGIGHMTSLHTLGYFDLSSNSLENVQSLSMLTNLRDLQLTCSTKEPESLNMKTPFLLMNMILERLSNLKSLTLVPTRTSSSYTKSINDDTGATCIFISDGFSTLSSAPAFLQGFVVSPRICIFSCTPKWIGQLHKLGILKFGIRKIDRDGVDVLRGLSALGVLSLYVHTKPAAKIVIGKSGFPVIKYFKLKCCDPCLEFEEGSMPNLHKLKLAFNACNADQPSTMPLGIKYLSHLKEVSAKIYGAEESRTRTAELAFRDVIRVHARWQSINVQCVKEIISGEDDQNRNMTTEEYPRNQYPPSPAQAPRRTQNRYRHWRDNTPREQTTVRQMLTPTPYEDGYQWRKSGQRMINNEHFPRCYYSCTYRGSHKCRAIKQVQQYNDGSPPLFVVKYCNHHTCVAEANPEQGPARHGGAWPMLDKERLLGFGLSVGTSVVGVGAEAHPQATPLQRKSCSRGDSSSLGTTSSSVLASEKDRHLTAGHAAESSSSRARQPSDMIVFYDLTSEEPLYVLGPGAWY